MKKKTVIKIVGITAISMAVIVATTAILIITGVLRKPEDIFAGQIEKEVINVANTVGKKYEKIMELKENKYGYDVNMTVDLNDEVYGDTKIDKIGIKTALDFKGGYIQAKAESTINDKLLLNAKTIGSPNRLYINLPDYTTEYLGLDADSSIKIDEIPGSGTISQMIYDYGKEILGSFKYSGRDKGANIDKQGIFFKAIKYTGECTADKYNKAITDVKEKFKKTSTYDWFTLLVYLKTQAYGEAFDISKILADSNEKIDYSKIKLDVYLGKQGKLAYEIVKDNGEILGYITDGTNWYVYKEDKLDTTILASHVVGMDSNGKDGTLYIGSKYNGITISYSDLDKTATKNKKNKEETTIINSLKFKVSLTGNGVTTEIASGSYKNGDIKKIESTLNLEGREVAKVNIDITKREANSITLPDKYYSYDDIISWESTMDAEKLMADIDWVYDNFGKLSDLIGDLRDRLAPSETEVRLDVDKATSKDLEKFKGYDKDVDYVCFNPKEEDVMQANQQSTAVHIMEVQDINIIKKVEQYIAKSEYVKDFKKQEETTYTISGEQGKLQSEYIKTVKYFKDDDHYMAIDYEAVTGKVSKVYLRGTDFEETCKLTQDIFDIVCNNTSTAKLEEVYADSKAIIKTTDTKISATLIGAKNYDDSDYYSGIIE